MTKITESIIKKCTDCIYSSLETTTGYWEHPDETDLICNYPEINTVEFQEYDREEVDYHFGDDSIDEATDCSDFTHYLTIDKKL